MSAWLLRKQNLLRKVAKEHRSSCSAARQVWFRSTERRNFTFRGCGRWIESSCGNIVDFLEPRLHGAFAAAARAHLYSPHLIRRA
jgi:hypothetical protein